MRKISYIIFAFLFFVACHNKNENAKIHLNNARKLLQQNEFQYAKNELDSINNLYPKAFEERKAGLLLLDSIRKAENDFTIHTLTQQMTETKSKVLELKSKFLYEKNPDYQDTGTYYPLQYPKSFTENSLQTGVYENGVMFLKSVYRGSQQHNKILVSIDGESIESLQVPDEGFIHRFNDLGQAYEIIFLQQPYDNGIAKFIAQNTDKKISVELLGKNNYKYMLNEKSKRAITEAYLLSTQMLLLDSLKTEKEKAEYKNFYLKNGKKTSLDLNEGTTDLDMKEIR